MSGEAQGVIDVIRGVVGQETRRGARVDYQYATIVDGSSSYDVSAYLSGDTDNLTDTIHTSAGQYLNSGDYAIIQIDQDGRHRVDKILTKTLYAKLAIDFNNGRIYIGDGNGPPLDPGISGQKLLSGGATGSAYWG